MRNVEDLFQAPVVQPRVEGTVETFRRMSASQFQMYQESVKADEIRSHELIQTHKFLMKGTEKKRR